MQLPVRSAATKRDVNVAERFTYLTKTLTLHVPSARKLPKNFLAPGVMAKLFDQ